MDAIQIDDAVVIEQLTLSPRFILFGQRLVETTHRAGAGGYSQQFFRHFPHLMGRSPADKHLGQRFGDLWFIAVVALEDLGVKLPLSIVFEL
jgi:hypothetical protein